MVSMVALTCSAHYIMKNLSNVISLLSQVLNTKSGPGMDFILSSQERFVKVERKGSYETFPGQGHVSCS